MNILLALKRPFIWLRRFRYRCGYGVHSPFAFEFITDVIYEKTPYYGYKEIAAEVKKQKWQQPKGWNDTPRRVNRLLFRLVNRRQPDTLVDVGTPSAASVYLQAAKVGVDYTFAADLTELFLETGVPVDFLYLHHYCNPTLVEEIFRVCVSRTTPQSLFVIEGIRYSQPMKELWRRLQEDERTGITFDLYDLGIIFFDRSKIKQHYIVNF